MNSPGRCFVYRIVSQGNGTWFAVGDFLVKVCPQRQSLSIIGTAGVEYRAGRGAVFWSEMDVFDAAGTRFVDVVRVAPE